MSRRPTSCLLILDETVKGQSDKVDILNGDFNARLAHFQSPSFPISLPFYPHAVPPFSLTSVYIVFKIHFLLAFSFPPMLYFTTS